MEKGDLEDIKKRSSTPTLPVNLVEAGVVQNQQLQQHPDFAGHLVEAGVILQILQRSFIVLWIGAAKVGVCVWLDAIFSAEREAAAGKG